MKKLLTLTAACALTMPVLVQAKDTKENNGIPTVYGQAHLSYGTIDKKVNGTQTVDNWQVRSHASRIGFKGERDFGDGLSAIYKFEWQVDYEQSTDAGLDRRNMYAGLKGGWGQVRVGRHDTPLKMAQGKFDQFGDTDADLKNAGDEDGENRLDNVLLYMGKTGNVGYALMIAPGEDGSSNTADDGPADTVSASISYANKSLYLAVAHDSYENGGNSAEDSITRFVGTYKFSGMQLGVLAQSGVEAADTAAAKEDWVGVSFNTKIGKKGKLKAQYITVEDNQTSSLESTLYAVGYDFSLDKKTTAYVMHSNLEEEQAGSKTLENTFTGVGMKFKF